MKIAGFLKVRNEIVREQNLYRALENLVQICDGGVVCDDASTDGTDEVLERFVLEHPNWSIRDVSPDKQSFAREMLVKQEMLERLHERGGWDWIWWLDGDEVLDAEGTRELRRWLASNAGDVPGFKFHYTQFWRTTWWARTDGGFDDGVFVKLWRYRPDLSFDTSEGLHRSQFPTQIAYDACPVAPFEVLHYGNVGKNLVWKAVQYAGGRGGVDRHIAFGHTPEESLATGEGFDQAKWSSPSPTYRLVDETVSIDDVVPRPKPFTLEEIRRIRSMRDLRGLEGWFTVIIPSFNRAETLPKALRSLLQQTYDRWIAVVLDDGSTDDTPRVMREWQDADPRIFYARYPTNRGGVAMNEIGMAIACEATEYWTRLGSDDWFGPRKLELDARAFAERSVGACYGSYTVLRDGAYAERCNPAMPADHIKRTLLAGGFLVSWANCAVRTEVLRFVRARWGSFCDRRLRNCEDFLVNARIAAEAPWTWRHAEGDVVHVGYEGPMPERPWFGEGVHPAELEAVWTSAAAGGASSPENAATLARDEQLTRELIREIQGGRP